MFFNHPIINAIVRNPWLTKYALYRESGIANGRTFLKELQMLIDDRHMEEFYGYYNLTSYVLSQYAESYCCNKFQLAYKPSKELEELFKWESPEIGDAEDEFDFHLVIAGIEVEQLHKEVLESYNDIDIDLKNYSYKLFAEDVNLRTINDPYDKTPFNIVHLDDNRIFAAGLEKQMTKFFPNCKWHYFTDVQDALACIESSFKEEQRIHFIIIDIPHAGLDSYAFAKEVRRLEDLYWFNTSILVLSLAGKDNPLVQKGIEEKVFTQYYPKTVYPEYLASYLSFLFTPMPQTDDKNWLTWKAY